MAGQIKQKLAVLLVDALSEKGAISFDPNKLKRQFPTPSCDCAMWYCSVPTNLGVGIEVYGWGTMTECVKHGISLTKNKGFFDAYANFK